jgi:hypothetical protein
MRGFDLGPIFVSEPFAGVRAARQVVSEADWDRVIALLADGKLDVGQIAGEMRTRTDRWSSTVLLGLDSGTTASGAVVGSRRPVMGVVAGLDVPSIPDSEGIWKLASPPYLRPGPDLGRIAPLRSLANWPRVLLGVDWPGSSTVPPPAAFVVGRIQSTAWIVRVEPDFKAEQLKIHIAWDESKVDPLSCTLVIRHELDGLPLSTRAVRISDYPNSDGTSSAEPRSMDWKQRLLTVAVPRGPRRTDWGVQLLAPDGRLLDERPVATRIEELRVSLRVGPEATPVNEFSVGDSKPPPTSAERDLALEEASNIETDAYAAAAVGAG